MTPEMREDIVEALRCAADLCQGPDWGSAVGIVTEERELLFFIVTAAARAAGLDVVHWAPETKMLNLLEAAARLEESA